MKVRILRFLRRLGRQSARLRAAVPALDHLAHWWLESQFLALAGRSSGAFPEERCRRDFEDGRRYRAAQEAMARAGDAAATADPLVVDETGVGQYTSRVLDVTDLEDPKFMTRYTEIGFHLEDQHRKAWEKTFVSLLVDRLVTRREAALGLGVANEHLLFYFANNCRRVVGIDLYDSPDWEGASMSPEQVYDLAPFPYRRECLEVRHMDMRQLDFPPDSFDFVWSISVIEHVDSIDDLETVFAGIERVLKPGGHAFLTTEWNLVPENPRYVPGLIVFDEPLLRHLLATVPALELLGPVLTRQTPSDLHTYQVHWTSNRNKEVPPLYNIFASGTFCTPVVLVLRKERIPN